MEQTTNNNKQLYISLKLKPEVLLGKLMKALLKNEELTLALNPNKSDNPNAPHYTSVEGAVWIKESKFSADSWQQ